jgi:hypothetical protein
MTSRKVAFLTLLLVGACSSVPTPKHRKYSFSEDVYVSNVKRPYIVLGQVRTKVDFPSLDPNSEERDLCRNYYNKASQDLLKRAKDVHADAVIDAKSVVFLEDGRMETYPSPECSDDGEEGQVLLQGIAIKWKPVPSPTPSETLSR